MRMVEMHGLPRPRILVETPQLGDAQRRAAFTAAVCRFALMRGYAPLPASLFSILHDVLGSHPEVRYEEGEAASEAMEQWAESAREVWMCLPLGMRPTQEMREAYARHRTAGRPLFIQRFSSDGGWLMQTEEPTTASDHVWRPEPALTPAGETT